MSGFEVYVIEWKVVVVVVVRWRCELMTMLGDDAKTFGLAYLKAWARRVFYGRLFPVSEYAPSAVYSIVSL